jgi:hypothetical protein
MTNRHVLASVLVCLLANADSAVAQNAPPEFIQVLTVTAKPDGALDYEDFVKKVVAAAAKAGAPQRVTAYAAGAGGPAYSYVFVTPFNKWAETDAFISPADSLRKAHGDVEAAKILRAGRANVAHLELVVYRLLKDLSTKPRAFDPPPAHVQLIRTQVKPDKVGDWERFLARYKAASEQMPETPPALRRVSVEGPAYVYVTAQPYSKGADRDAWPALMDILKKAYGDKEADALNELRAGSIKSTEFSILHHRPDLSSAPPAPK